MRGTAVRWASGTVAALVFATPTLLLAAERMPLTEGTTDTAAMAVPDTAPDSSGGSSTTGDDAHRAVIEGDLAEDRVDEPANGRLQSASERRAVFSLIPPAPAAMQVETKHRFGPTFVDHVVNASTSAIVGSAAYASSSAHAALGGVSAGLRQEVLVTLREALALGADSLARGPSTGVHDRSGSDAFIVWLPHTGLALSGGVAWLRRSTESRRRGGAYASVQLTY